MFSGDPLGHCYRTLAPKLKRDQDKDTNFDSLPDERMQVCEEAAAEEKTEDVKGVKRDSRGAVVKTTMSDPVGENTDQNEQKLSDLGGSDREAIKEEQPKVTGLQVGTTTYLCFILSSTIYYLTKITVYSSATIYFLLSGEEGLGRGDSGGGAGGGRARSHLLGQQL